MSYGGSPERYSRSRSRSPRGDREIENPDTVFVGGLAHDTDESVLTNYFEKLGPVISSKARSNNVIRPFVLHQEILFLET
jgi:RNA recognition motif-containing protein